MTPDEVFEDCCSSDEELFEDCPLAVEDIYHLATSVNLRKSSKSSDDERAGSLASLVRLEIREDDGLLGDSDIGHNASTGGLRVPPTSGQLGDAPVACSMSSTEIPGSKECRPSPPESMDQRTESDSDLGNDSSSVNDSEPNTSTSDSNDAPESLVVCDSTVIQCVEQCTTPEHLSGSELSGNATHEVKPTASFSDICALSSPGDKDAATHESFHYLDPAGPQKEVVHQSEDGLQGATAADIKTAESKPGCSDSVPCSARTASSAEATDLRNPRQPSSSSEDSVVESLVARSPSSDWEMLLGRAGSPPESPSSDEDLSSRLARGDWHVLDQSSATAAEQVPATAQVRYTSDSAVQDLTETLAEAHDLTEALAEECASLAVNVESGGVTGSGAVGGDFGDAGAVSSAQGDATDEPELMADPDAVDEEELKQLDESQTEEQCEARRVQAVNLKADGNRLFASESYDAARERYTCALRLCPLTAERDRAVLYSNRATCRARALDETGAIEDCGRALKLDPNYVKPLQRRAELLYKQEKLDESLADWQRLLELQPGNAEARRAVAHLPAEIEERNEKLKTEMFAKLKDLGNMILRPFNLSTDNFQMEQNDSGGYSVKFNPS